MENKSYITCIIEAGAISRLKQIQQFSFRLCQNFVNSDKQNCLENGHNYVNDNFPFIKPECSSVPTQ